MCVCLWGHLHGPCMTSLTTHCPFNYTMFTLISATMKWFKIKAIKTYVSYITNLLFYILCGCKHKRKWHPQKTLYNICLKTGLFKVKLYYINFMRLFYQEIQEIWRYEEHTVMRRKPRRQVSDFSNDFCCIKTTFTFLLQIIQSKWFLMFVLSVKNCFNTKKETLSSVYLLITEIYPYWSYGDGIDLPITWKSNSSKMEMYVLCSL